MHAARQPDQGNTARRKEDSLLAALNEGHAPTSEQGASSAPRAARSSLQENRRCRGAVTTACNLACSELHCRLQAGRLVACEHRCPSESSGCAWRSPAATAGAGACTEGEGSLSSSTKHSVSTNCIAYQVIKASGQRCRYGEAQWRSQTELPVVTACSHQAT
jgi:hypothetical protein